MRNTRDTRAVERKSSHGRAVAAVQWAGAEFAALCAMWAQGVPVPYPVQIAGTEILMEFVGDGAVAAPRLAQTRPDAVHAGEWFRQVTEILHGFARAGFAHGDMSAYNLLVHLSHRLDDPDRQPDHRGRRAFHAAATGQAKVQTTVEGARCDVEFLISAYRKAVA